MKKYIVALCLFALTSGAQAMNKIEVQGHRGARAIKPENTLAAFEYALSIGVDTLELDINVTKDNVMVISHDTILNSTICRDNKGGEIKGQIPIRSLTYAQLQNYNCASVKNPRFPKQTPDKNQKIATLKELFELVKNSKDPHAKTVQFNIETKITPAWQSFLSPEPKEFAKMILDLAKEYGFLDRVVLQSFDHRSLKEAKKLYPKVRVSALFEGMYMINAVDVVKSIPAEIVSPDLNFIDKKFVDDMHKAGIKVIPWTADEVREWDFLVKIGVDGIISDDPQALMDFLKTKKLR